MATNYTLSRYHIDLLKLLIRYNRENKKVFRFDLFDDNNEWTKIPIIVHHSVLYIIQIVQTESVSIQKLSISFEECIHCTTQKMVSVVAELHGW